MATDLSTPPRARRRTPETLLIALFGLTLAGLVWLDAAQRQVAERAVEVERINAENGSLARAFEEHVRRVLQATDNALLFLAAEYQTHGRVTESMVKFVERAKRDPVLNQIAVADASGNVLLSAVALTRPINIAKREHFSRQAADAHLGLYIGKPIVTMASGTWSFFASRRLDGPGGAFAGIVSAGLDPAYFASYYNDPDLGRDRAIMLVGRDGIVRTRRFQQQAEVGQDLHGSPLFAMLPRAGIGHYEVVGVIDQLRRFASYRAMPDYPMVVVVSDLSASALAPYERRAARSRLTALVLTLFIAGVCLALIRGARWTRRQNEHLTQELAERRRAEQALRASQDLFATFLDNIPAVVFVQDLQGEILYANQAYRDQPGREAIGRNARELLAPRGGTGPDAASALRGTSVTLDETVRGKDGEPLVFETRMFVAGRRDDTPLLGCIAVDSTRRRQAEQQRLVFERRMQQTQKLESLGVLAGGVAHDFNNLLMVILGNTELALARTAPEAPSRGFLESVETAAHRAADLTNQMLAYSGKGRFVIEPVNLSHLVGEMGHLLGTVVAKNAEVRYELAADLPLVQADATQIRQVVMNLITNASDAIGAGPGTITIATRTVSIAADTPLSGFFDHSLQPGRYVIVEVADTGSGMDQATLARIFDPFFTTKHTGRGLGLASVLGIVQGHGGGIRVESRPGEGTGFSVLLPESPDAARLQPAADQAQPPAEAAADGPRLVLVVDDEQSVRATAEAMLQDHGFAVIAAGDGVEGVELFRSRHAELAAVLLDMSMPRMGGEDAFRAMQRIDPSVPVLLMSGYDESEAVGRFTGTGLAGFIRKPYRIAALVERLRQAIAARRPSSG